MSLLQKKIWEIKCWKPLFECTTKPTAIERTRLFNEKEGVSVRIILPYGNHCFDFCIALSIVMFLFNAFFFSNHATVCKHTVSNQSIRCGHCLSNTQMPAGTIRHALLSKIISVQVLYHNTWTFVFLHVLPVWIHRLEWVEVNLKILYWKRNHPYCRKW